MQPLPTLKISTTNFAISTTQTGLVGSNRIDSKKLLVLIAFCPTLKLNVSMTKPWEKQKDISRTKKTKSRTMTLNGLKKNKETGRNFSKVNLPMLKRILSGPKKMLHSGVKTQRKRREKHNVNRVTTMSTLNSSKKVRLDRKTKKSGWWECYFLVSHRCSHFSYF